MSLAVHTVEKAVAVELLSQILFLKNKSCRGSRSVQCAKKWTYLLIYSYMHLYFHCIVLILWRVGCGDGVHVSHEIWQPIQSSTLLLYFFFLHTFFYQSSHSCIDEKIVGMMCQAKTYSSLHFFAWQRSPQVMVCVILDELWTL